MKIMKPATLATLLVATLAFAGCVKEQNGEGRLRLQFSVNPAVSEQRTRAFSIEAPEASEFALLLVSSDGTYDKSWSSLSDFPTSGVYVKAGAYTATATCGDPTEEGFGKAAFGVTESFSVSDGRTVIQSMEATLVNMGVTVSYTTAFEGYFPEHYAVITTAAGNEISFQDSETETNSTKTAYINPAEFTLTIYYTRQSGNTGSQVFAINNTTFRNNAGTLIEPIGARKWANITIDVNGDTGGVGDGAINITFDDTVTDEGREIETGENE
jgi:hypothetical protein